MWSQKPFAFPFQSNPHSGGPLVLLPPLTQGRGRNLECQRE